MEEMGMSTPGTRCAALDVAQHHQAVGSGEAVSPTAKKRRAS
jgi:hypothetical protein